MSASLAVSSPTGERTASVAGAGVIRMGMHTHPKTADEQVQKQDDHDSELSDFSKSIILEGNLHFRVVKVLLEANEAHVHHDRAATHKGSPPFPVPLSKDHSFRGGP